MERFSVGHMLNLTTLAEFLVAAGTLLLAYFTYESVSESGRVRKSQYEVNLDLFVVSASSVPANTLFFKMVNYGPGTAKDVLVECNSTKGVTLRSEHPYLAPFTPSQEVALGLEPDGDDYVFAFSISYSDLLGKKKSLQGELSKTGGLWEFVKTG